MIPAPNSPFLTEEARKVGSEPKFTFAIHPFDFATGIAAGSGTFVNCFFIAPNTIQVDYQALHASWTSPVMESIISAGITGTIDIAYILSSAGYIPLVEFRTATTLDGLEAIDWVEFSATASGWFTSGWFADPWFASLSEVTNLLINGASCQFYRYYQWRVSWIVYRNWTQDASPGNLEDAPYMWALDEYDPSNYFQSYTSDNQYGNISYLKDVTFLGEYPIPFGDIADGGSLSLVCPKDFSDLTSADHTLTLINRDGVYSPGNPDFVFSADYWYLKELRISLGYKRPGVDVIDAVVLYNGVITKWGPVVHRVGQDGKFEEHTIEIYSRDRIAYLLDKKIGVPDVDGTPRPAVYGDVFRQADQLGDQMVGNPYMAAYFEGNSLAELAKTSTSNGGTVSIANSNAYNGAYCLETAAGNANASGYGKLMLLASAARFFFAGYVKFVTFPTSPTAKLTYFLAILGDTATSNYIRFMVDTDGKVYLNFNGAEYETSWYIDDYQNSWRRVAVGIYGNVNPGILKVWVDGTEVFAKTDISLTGYKFQGVQLGPVIGSSAESYTLDWDDLQLWGEWYPQLYKIAGDDYTAITSVYVDGSIRVENARNGVVNRIIAGRAPNPDNIALYPENGAIAFTDQTEEISGTVMIRATQNTTTNPVDMITALLTLAGVDDLIDTTNFAAAKTALASDIVNAYFENVAIGEALQNIASACLLDIFMDQGLIRLKAYTGTAPATYVMSIDESLAMALEQTIDMEEIKTKINAKYGWYDRNKKLYYSVSDATALTAAGEKAEDLDYSWGAAITSESYEVAKDKADKLLLRKKGGQDLITLAGPLSLARLELRDSVQINIPFIRDGVIYDIFRKSITMTQPYQVELELVRFLGES